MTQSNIRLLEQGLALLEDLDNELFAKPEPRVGSGGLGAQLRHVLDFYACLLRGAEAREINYDARERDARLETERAYAVNRIGELIDELGALEGIDEETAFRVQLDAEPGAERWSQSSFGRELRFLQSHTIHHFAIIAVILRLNGVEPGAAFGMAPSTLAWQKENEAAPAH